MGRWVAWVDTSLQFLKVEFMILLLLRGNVLRRVNYISKIKLEEAV